MFVDLHIHSYFSDGAQTPEQAALACRDSGVGLAALCDHNNWLGCERFAAACEDLGVIAIRGVEFDCRWQGYHLHILGYGFTPTPELAELSHRCRELLLQMSVDLVERMAPEYPQLSPREYRDFRYDTLLGGWAASRPTTPDRAKPSRRRRRFFARKKGCLSPPEAILTGFSAISAARSSSRSAD